MSTDATPTAPDKTPFPTTPADPAAPTSEAPDDTASNTAPTSSSAGGEKLRHNDEQPTGQVDPAASAKAAPLPTNAEEIDARLDAALVMVKHGIRRLSRLAGNIRFAFLQRDESRLIHERQALKARFQNQEHGVDELVFGLQALLHKAERLAGSLLYQPQAQSSASDIPAPDSGTTVTDSQESDAPQSEKPLASSPASAPSPATPAAETPLLSRERSNQLRQTLRKAMMSLAPAAPLHLQIELAPEFPETDPDIMAMAARIHALHRAVLGSLKRVLWHTPIQCTLGFDNGQTITVLFDEHGVVEIPEAFRQKQNPVPSEKRRSKPAGYPIDKNSRKGDQQPRQRPGAQKNEQQGKKMHRLDTSVHSDGQNTAAQGTLPGTVSRHHNPTVAAAERRPERYRSTNQEDRLHQRRPHRAGESSQASDMDNPGKSPAQIRNPMGGKRHHDTRRNGAGGNSGRNNRKPAFITNSAMADKLRAALGESYNQKKKNEQ